jgi:hypothetical protein
MNAQFQNVSVEAYSLFDLFKKEVENTGNMAIIDAPVNTFGIDNHLKINDYLVRYSLWGSNYFILSKDKIDVACYIHNLDALLDYIEEKLEVK